MNIIALAVEYANPFVYQIAAASFLHTRIERYVDAAYLITLSVFCVPLFLQSLWYRSQGDAELLLETKAIMAFATQTLYYAYFQLGMNVHPVYPALTFILFVVELNFSKKEWFAHSFVLLICLFGVIKVYLGMAHSHFTKTNMQSYFTKTTTVGWRAVVYLEFCMLATMLLVEFWMNVEQRWFNVFILIALPYAFPTSNGVLEPQDTLKRGILGITNSNAHKFMLTNSNRSESEGEEEEDATKAPLPPPVIIPTPQPVIVVAKDIPSEIIATKPAECANLMDFSTEPTVVHSEVPVLFQSSIS